MTQHDTQDTTASSEEEKETTAHEEPYGYHYAVGAFDRLCRTEYCQPRERSVEDYDETPSKKMVVDDMIQRYEWAHDPSGIDQYGSLEKAEAQKGQAWCRANGGSVAWEQTSNVVHDMRCKINGITVEPYG